MPTNAPITFQNGTLPEGFCFTDWQTTFNKFTSLLSGYLPGSYNTFNYGNTEPSANDRSKPWFRLNVDGSPDKWYVYFGGSWVSPHPVEPGSDEIRTWRGLLANLDTYDGGEAGAVTDTTGPMWEEVTEMRGLVPLGVGTLASGTVVGVGDTGGEETHTLTQDEVPAHGHPAYYNTGAETISDSHGGIMVGPGSSLLPENTGDASEDRGKAIGGSGGGKAHNNMPPYKGVYFIQRTARKYYTPG